MTRSRSAVMALAVVFLMRPVFAAASDDGPSHVLFSSAYGSTAIPLAAPPTPGKTLRLPVTRDTWFSAVGKEADGNLGAAGQLKLKSNQEMSIVDLDPAELKGRIIRRAVLHVRKRGEEVLHRVTVSSISADWVEGTSSNYEPQKGSSCFNFREYPDVPWAHTGSDLTAVTLGQGGSVWGMAEATAPDAQGWMQIAVDPAVVAARVAGISQGFLLFDDTGSEWTRRGEQFTIKPFPNRYIFSKDNGRQNAPYFTVELGDESRDPPAAPGKLQSTAAGLPAGEAELSWLTPADRGSARVIGFGVEANGKPVPQYLVPAAGKPGAPVTMALRDIGLKPGETVQISVRAIDGAGNAGAPATLSVATSDTTAPPLPGASPAAFSDGGPLPRIGGAEVAIVDALDKAEAASGRMIPQQDPAYLAANHLWSAKQKKIRLHAARNEFVSFQILLRGTVKDLTAKLAFDGAAAPDAAFFSLATVSTKAGRVPDPLIPLAGAFTTAQGESNESLLCEIYVPHEAAAGVRTGMLTLASDGEELKFAVELGVWDFTLPDVLSFIPEMNCYGLPANEADYYRLAHRNRTVINRVPYHQSGAIEDGCAPRWNGKQLDWSAWDRRFGPYLDGSAFNDLPRKGVPLDILYLPIFENWPSPMEGNYNGSYWADQAFPESYRRAFVEVSRQFAEHFNARKWDATMFHCFFNGKNNFKEGGWSRESSPWVLDEPMHFQDFWALRWFGQAFHEGISAAPGSARMMFRCDISRPQWQRDALDGLLNYNVVAGGPFHQYHRLVLDRKRKYGQVVIPYGSTNNPADSNMQPVGWCLDSWTLGADGVLPWQVIGSAESWKQGEDTCLFYPGETVGRKEPVASIRLKAYLRGEQDVEYLALLANVLHQSQTMLGQSVRAALQLKSVRKSTGFVGGEDAGVIDFAGFRPQDAWALRERVGAVLSAAHPAAQRKLSPASDRP